MSNSLLDSQLLTLEPPTADEAPISVDVAHSPDMIVRVVRESLGKFGGVPVKEGM